MSHVDTLAEAGLVDPSQLSQEHKDIIDNQVSDAEVSALVSVQAKLGGAGSMHGPHSSVF